VAKLAGVLRSALSDTDLADVAAVVRAARADAVPAVRVEGPAALRPFLAAGCATDEDGAGRTVLAVTATDREAEDLAAAAADLIGPALVAVLPSWETLPHERLSPRPDTVGRRLDLFRRLAGDTPPRVVVAAARSLIQPIAPGLGRLDPVHLRVGDGADFDAVLERLVELAYTRVEMVTARGEFAVRGGIVDVFPPTAEHPVRTEFWGDEVSELRSFSVADQRSVDIGLIHDPHDVGCLDRASVEDTHRGRGVGRPPPGDALPDRRAHLLRVVGCGHLTGADGPHRLVRDHQTGDLYGRQARQ